MATPDHSGAAGDALLFPSPSTLKPPRVHDPHSTTPQQPSRPVSRLSHPRSSSLVRSTVDSTLSPSRYPPTWNPAPSSSRSLGQEFCYQKISRPSSRRSSPMGRQVRSKTAPGTPLRLPLSDAFNISNRASSSPSPPSGDGTMQDLGYRPVMSTAKPATRNILPRKHTIDSLSSPASSPLKRSDTIFNLDSSSLSTHAAKRRSIHGVASDVEFQIFDESRVSADPPTSSARAPPVSMSGDASGDLGVWDSPSMPRRSSSLRMSTMQQRHGERPSFVYSRPGAPDLAFEFTAPSFAASEHRVRSSLSSKPANTRRSLMGTTNDQLVNASMHVVRPQHRAHTHSLSLSQHAHPLSRIVNSSPSPVTRDEPFKEPRLILTSQPLRVDFSKSLPIGAIRPGAKPQPQTELNPPETGDNQESYVTPQSYKFAKPLPAAFMSTGLISKRTWNVEQSNDHAISTHISMPDTPCKRPQTSVIEAAALQMEPRAGIVGNGPLFPNTTPSTPFTAKLKKDAPPSTSKGISIFGGSYLQSRLNRSDSFNSIDALEAGASPPGFESTQTLSEHELPPTPTKPNTESPKSPTQHKFNIFGKRSPDQASEPVSGFTTWPIRGSTSPLDRAKVYNRRRPITPSSLQTQSGTIARSVPRLTPALGLTDERATQSAGNGPPSTPTGARGLFPSARTRRSSVTPITSFTTAEVDESLTEKFSHVELIGAGQFSQVFRVTGKGRQFESKSILLTPDSSYKPFTDSRPIPVERIFAVKKSRRPYSGQRDRSAKLKEVSILQRLGHGDHVIAFLDHWEHNDHLYIQTEFCEEGSLDLFLSGVGKKARLDDFRTWKILLELSLGVCEIHQAGVIHLDLKPANVLVMFEGVLKIADFGMATTWPAAPGIEGEGDREYIGPEILQGRYDKPADIFALGMIMVEIVGNVELPDNGPSWQKLRTGDLSEIPSLTWSSESGLARDPSGVPFSSASPSWADSSFDRLGRDTFSDKLEQQELEMKGPPSNARSGEASHPPEFIANVDHESSLANLVRWMISPEPLRRPTAQQLLEAVGLRWVEKRRRAGATVFEGNWGPADHIVEDVEMQDAWGIS